MNDPIWKLMPMTLMQQTQVVFREWPDGRQESCFVTTTEYLKWLAEGNVPLPASDSVDEVAGTLIPTQENSNAT